MELTHGSLFSGIGGFDLGLERCGIKTLWQVEIDDYANKVLSLRFPDAKRFRDIKECGAKNLERVDVISGGFPCQDISDAGKKEGITGSRSGLWTEYLRIIGELRPRFVVVENVAALYHRGLGVVLGGLASCGYDAEWDCIPAAAVGAPHLRERIWIVAYDQSLRGREGKSIPRVFERQIQSDANGSGKDVSDSKSQRCGRRNLQSDSRNESKNFKVWNQGGSETIQRLRFWDVEPDVGGTLDGFSSWLDGFDMTHSHMLILAHGTATKARPKEVLREVHHYLDTQTIGGYAPISSEAVLFAFVCQLANKATDKTWLQLESQEASKDRVRGVSADAHANRPSHRSRNIPQRTIQHSDPLQTLSRLLALDAEKAWSAYRRSDASIVLGWEQGYSRIAHAVPNRVERLKCLGNAIVPQIAEWIGRQIMAFDRELPRKRRKA